MMKIDDAGSPVVDVAYKTAAGETRVMPWNDLDPLAVADGSEKSDVIIGECGYRSRQIRGHATSGSFWPRVPAADTASRRY